MKDLNDEKVISAIRNRDEIAISEVITRYSRLLWKTAGAVLNQIGSVQDIEECVADTFICLWEHPDRYDPRRGKLKTWLSIVARTQAVNRCREITKRRIVSLDDASFLYVGYHILRILNLICRFYLTVIRGTPVVVQLMIAYLIIFASSKNGVPVAIFAFGVNSGAYVAEIFRGGIMSIDGGQFEAGRSLGFNYLQTMWHIIIPQMFKAVLPTLCNEFIALLKETLVAGYVGVVDLTKAGNIIAGRTFNYFIPLFTVALVYLTLVVILSWLVGRLERRLRRSER